MYPYHQFWRNPRRAKRTWFHDTSQWRHNERDGVTIVYSTVHSGADQRKHQSSASLAFVRGIQRWPVNYPHKGPVTRKMFPLDDVIMNYLSQWCHISVMVSWFAGSSAIFSTFFSEQLQGKHKMLQYLPSVMGNQPPPFSVSNLESVSIALRHYIYVRARDFRRADCDMCMWYLFPS